jgi:chaperonin cofactor prefoldin
MKERSRERFASVLLEELLEQLSQNENIRRMLGDMTSVPTEEVIERLTEEFETAVARYHDVSLEKSRSRRSRAVKGNEDTTREDAPTPIVPTPASVLESPPHAPLPPVVLKGTKSSPALSSGDDNDGRTRTKGASLRHRFEEIEQRLMSRLAAKPSHVSETGEDEDLEDRDDGEEADVFTLVQGGRRDGLIDDGVDIDEDTDDEEVEGDTGAFDAVVRTPFAFADDDAVYLHAVTRIPAGEQPAEYPFMLEEKGIDGRGFAFALDRNDLRFYLSKTARSMSVSKTGMLLLNQEDSIQVRSASESILNDLRGHGALLPFEFGTVMRSKEELFTRIDQYEEELQEALEEELETATWTLTLSALDARIAKLVGTPSSGGRRGRERTRESAAGQSRHKGYDLKVLEKILNRQKRIAQSIHDVLRKTADDSGIKSIVTLMSGSSGDWKPILTAWYEVDPDDLRRFYNTIIELQYQNIMFDLMFSLAGQHERFSFGKL